MGTLCVFCLPPPPPNSRQAVLIKVLSSILYMNKDLAGVSAIWRALFGVRGRRFYCVIGVFVVLLSKSHRRCFAADNESVSEDGHSFRCCTVGGLLRDVGFGVCDGGTAK